MTITLRPYQRQCADAVLACLERRKNPILVLATGAGKTVICTDIFRTVLGNTRWRLGFFVHRRELLHQASRALRDVGIPHGIVAPGHEPGSERVHVASIDTVVSRIGKGDPATSRWFEGLDLANLDEGHHIAAETYSKIALRMHGRRMSLSATPYRLDGKGLGDFFDEAVTGPGMRELVEMGFLAPLEIYAPNIAVDLSLAKKVGADYRLGDIQAIMDTDDLNREAVRAYGRWTPGEPSLAFCTGIDHAARMAEAFRKAGWSAVSVDGTMKDDDRDAAVEGLRDGAIQVLTSCQILGEGLDIPMVSSAILARPTLSTMLLMQQVGRSMRPHPDKGAARIIDMVGNIKAHGMPDEPRQWSLKGGIKGLEKLVTPTRRCPWCCRVHRWAPVCITPGCGYRYPTVAAPQVGRARLAKVGGVHAEVIATLRFPELLRMVEDATYAEGLAIAAIRGYPAAWVDRIRAAAGKRVGT